MRVEILNGVERRRRWSDEEKARIIEETFAPGAKISEVARRRGVSRNLIYTWRRQARSGELVGSAAARLIPVRLAELSTPTVVAPAQKPPHSARAAEKKSGLIEIDLGGGRRVRVDADGDADALGRVLDVLGRR